jgi:hypothetical protein
VALWQRLRGRQEGGAGQTPGCQQRFEGQPVSWEVNASHPVLPRKDIMKHGFLISFCLTSRI